MDSSNKLVIGEVVIQYIHALKYLLFVIVENLRS